MSEPTPLRTLTNKAGVTEDLTKTAIFFASDWTGIKNWFAYVFEVIGTLQSALGFTPENVANKKTGLSDNSDTYYPSQKAVKTAVDAKLTIETPWSDWTPSFANFTKGNATVVARYTKIGKTVFFYLSVTLGSTSSMSSFPNFTLPVTAVEKIYPLLFGTGYILDNGIAEFLCDLFNAGADRAQLVARSMSGSYGSFAWLSATVPMTWATGDRFNCQGSYEAVS